MDVQVDRATSTLYAKLEERVMARDQVGASQVYYDLVRAGRPLKEIVAEGVRIHAPYTHVPYHERIDDGYPNFVNNDHCLLSARATINLTKMVPERLAMLPMAQTIWYIPSGLDIWNQKMDKAPGHYTRARGNLGAVRDIDRRSLLFIALSGLAGAASWLCYFRALQLGDALRVAPIDPARGPSAARVRAAMDWPAT